MTTITFDTTELTITSGEAPILITVDAAPPPLVINQIAGVGPPGPSGVHVGPTPPSDTSLVWVDTS